MPTPLADRLLTMEPSKMYDMLEQGWSVSMVTTALAMRKLPATRPAPPKRQTGRVRFRARGRVGVTGGKVDHSKIMTPNPREHVPGYSIPPWYRH